MFPRTACRRHPRGTVAPAVEQCNWASSPLNSPQLGESTAGDAVPEPSRLANWPVQLHLVPPHAPYLQGADLLLVADCVPFACAGFHRQFLDGRPVLIGCPKLDDGQFYVKKLAQIIATAGIRSIRVLHMEVPCCLGLVHIARLAIEAVGRRCAAGGDHDFTSRRGAGEPKRVSRHGVTVAFNLIHPRGKLAGVWTSCFLCPRLRSILLPAASLPTSSSTTSYQLRTTNYQQRTTSYELQLVPTGGISPCPTAHPLCEVLATARSPGCVSWWRGRSGCAGISLPAIRVRSFIHWSGPSGRSLTRMGHPGAANHDHHRSIWFAHEKVQDNNFWSDQTETRIRQKQWLAYQDGKDEALMAVLLGWYGGPDSAELLQQELIASVRPEGQGETLLELQSSFRPTAETLEFGKSNFGFLAVRVAKHLSAYFGGGRLTNSEGLIRRKSVFGKLRGGWITAVRYRRSAAANSRAPRRASPTLTIRAIRAIRPAGMCGATVGWALQPAWKNRCPPRGTNPSCCAICCMLTADLWMPTVPKSWPPALRAVVACRCSKPKGHTWSTASDAANTLT